MPIAASLAVVAVALAGWWFWSRANNPKRLLARAYTASRPFEFRLPADGPYRELAVQKGVGEGAFNQPAELGRAVAVIRERLAAEGETADLLRLRAHAELFEPGSRPSALSILERLHQSAPSDPETTLLLACAFYLRAQSAKSAEDNVHALNLLEEITSGNRPDPLALFNLALVWEAVPDNENAAEAWRRFLRADSSSGYATEAKRHLDALEKKARERGRLLPSPELLLEPALTGWLPQSVERGTPVPELTSLASRFYTQAGDPFLLHVLQAPLSRQGVRLLAEAALLSRSARAAEAVAKAQSAVREFSGSNPAAELLARSELVYALHRSVRSAACLDAFQELTVKLRGFPYHWMQAQNLIEGAVCHAYEGEISRAADLASQARMVAQEAGLRGTEMRAQVMLADFLAQAGNDSASWLLIPPALERYWSEPQLPNVANHAWLELSIAAQRLGWDHAAFAMSRASVDAIAQTRERLLEGIGRQRTAALARALNRAQDALAEERLAQKAFAEAPESPVRQTYLFDSRVYLADQTARGSGASAVIPELRSMLETPLPTEDGRTRVLSILGRALWQTGDIAGARSVALKAVEQGRSQSDTASRLQDSFRLLSEIQLSHDRDPKAALETWLTLRNLPVTAITHSAKPLPSAPAGDDLFIGFAELPGGWVRWSMSHSGVQWLRIASDPAEIHALSTRFVRECSDPESDLAALESDARALGQKLFAGLELPPGAGHIVLDAEPADLAGIPFALLLDSRVRPMIRSVGFSGALPVDPRSDIRRARVLVTDSPVPGPALEFLYPPLPEAGREATDIAGLFPNAVRLSGSAATASSVAGQSAGAVIFHFSGHAEGHTGRGALVLTPEDASRPYSGLFTADKIASADWRNCQLAVLSACSTAGRAGSHPFHPQSLVDAFLAAGVRRVVASLWNVDMAATRQLMRSFYRNLAAGSGAPEALYLAQQEMRTSSPPAFRHPYYWAAFQVFGST